MLDKLTVAWPPSDPAPPAPPSPTQQGDEPPAPFEPLACATTAGLLTVEDVTVAPLEFRINVGPALPAGPAGAGVTLHVPPVHWFCGALSVQVFLAAQV
ncbi:hypothetical protein [Acidocella sp.]|uniref:hypothetical protein n=1 Tax=Acidocella sp. TaxID=50710 RepID=UPI00263821E2|nr:hypothetical protein [Acidocella sp.]